MAAGKRLICARQALEEGGRGVRFMVNWAGGVQSAFVVRFGGQARAYLNRCGHIPVELDYQPGDFFDASRLYLICATHGALYDPATGACRGGRCSGRGLTPLPVVEEDDGIYLLEDP